MSIQILHDQRSLVIRERRESPKGETQRTYLVLGDLHIGFEEKFSQSGIRIQSNYLEMASEITEIVDKIGATDVIINGDLKSGTDRILRSEWENVPKFLSILSGKCHVSLVPGNHDGGLAHLVSGNVELVDASGLYVCGNLIIHGHTRPLAKYADCTRIIMGHVHPIFQRKGSPLSGQPLWILARVPRKALFRDSVLDSNASDLVEVIVMPSFNKELSTTGYSSEITREERKVSPLVRDVKDASDAIVSTLNGEIIGDAEMLRAIL